MKIHKQEATFQPITIVLESQEEVDQMFALASCVNIRGEINITFELFDTLGHIHKDGDKYKLEGSVLVKS